MRRRFITITRSMVTVVLLPFEAIMALIIRVIRPLIYRKGISSPVFILGHERSGTTFVYSKLCSTGKFSYLSNLDSIIFGSPLLSTLAQKCFHRNDFTSIKGAISKTSGFYTPSECIPFWKFIYRFGDNINYLIPDDYLTGRDVIKTFHRFFVYYTDYRSKLAGKRMIYKQPGNSVRVAYLLKIFPTANFIIIKREKDKIISSMMDAKERFKEDTSFWGIKIPEWDKLVKRDFQFQANAQYLFVESCLEDAQTIIPKENLHILQFNNVLNYSDQQFEKFSETLNTSVK